MRELRAAPAGAPWPPLGPMNAMTRPLLILVKGYKSCRDPRKTGTTLALLCLLVALLHAARPPCDGLGSAGGLGSGQVSVPGPSAGRSGLPRSMSGSAASSPEPVPPGEPRSSRSMSSEGVGGASGGGSSAPLPGAGWGGFRAAAPPGAGPPPGSAP